MVKRGDVLFSYAIITLIFCIILLLMPFEMYIVINILIGAIVLGGIFVLISRITIPKGVLQKENPKIGEIKKLIKHAEQHLDHDIHTSVHAYKKIKVHYSELERHEKSKVLNEVMSLYLKLLETLHLKH